MKNLKNFSELTENENVNPTNEGGKLEIAPEVASCEDVINILHALIDEGHFDSHGFPKSDLEDVNAFLAEQGHDIEGGYFKTDDEMDKFTNVVKASCQELINLL